MQCLQSPAEGSLFASKDTGAEERGEKFCKSDVTRAHSHDTAGRVKHDDLYAYVKAADPK